MPDYTNTSKLPRMELALQEIEGFKLLFDEPTPNYRITQPIRMPDIDCSYATYFEFEARQVKKTVFSMMRRFAITESTLKVVSWRQNDANWLGIEIKIQA